MSTDTSPQQPVRVISKKELARRADVSERTIDLWRAKGLTPPAVVVGRRIKFIESTASEWLLSRRVGG